MVNVLLHYKDSVRCTSLDNQSILRPVSAGGFQTPGDEGVGVADGLMMNECSYSSNTLSVTGMSRPGGPLPGGLLLVLLGVGYEALYSGIGQGVLDHRL